MKNKELIVKGISALLQHKPQQIENADQIKIGSISLGPNLSYDLYADGTMDKTVQEGGDVRSELLSEKELEAEYEKLKKYKLSLESDNPELVENSYKPLLERKQKTFFHQEDIAQELESEEEKRKKHKVTESSSESTPENYSSQETPSTNKSNFIRGVRKLAEGTKSFIDDINGFINEKNDTTHGKLFSSMIKDLEEGGDIKKYLKQTPEERNELRREIKKFVRTMKDKETVSVDSVDTNKEKGLSSKKFLQISNEAHFTQEEYEKGGFESSGAVASGLNTKSVDQVLKEAEHEKKQRGEVFEELRNPLHHQSHETKPVEDKHVDKNSSSEQIEEVADSNDKTGGKGNLSLGEEDQKEVKSILDKLGSNIGDRPSHVSKIASRVSGGGSRGR